MTKAVSARAKQLLPVEPEETCCPSVELRQYTIQPGKRDALIDLFEREFIESRKHWECELSVNSGTLKIRIDLFGSEDLVTCLQRA